MNSAITTVQTEAVSYSGEEDRNRTFLLLLPPPPPPSVKEEEEEEQPVVSRLFASTHRHDDGTGNFFGYLACPLFFL